MTIVKVFPGTNPGHVGSLPRDSSRDEGWTDSVDSPRVMVRLPLQKCKVSRKRSVSRSWGRIGGLCMCDTGLLWVFLLTKSTRVPEVHLTLCFVSIVSGIHPFVLIQHSCFRKFIITSSLTVVSVTRPMVGHWHVSEFKFYIEDSVIEYSSVG